MTMASIVPVIQRIADELQLEQFNVPELVQGLLQDGGHDFSRTTTPDLERAISGAPQTVWQPIAFGCSELIAYYLADANQFSKTQVLRGFTAILLLGSAIERGFGDWEFEFDKVLRFTLKASEQLPFNLRMEVLCRSIRCDRFLSENRVGD